jgi:hypothetical protein
MRTVFTSLLWVIGVSMAAVAAPVGQISIVEATKQAEVIVVGQIIRIDAPVAGTGQITLLPTSVLKGDVVAGPIVIGFEGFTTFNLAKLRTQRVLLFAKSAKDTQILRLLPLRPGATAPLEFQVVASDLAVSVPPMLRVSESDSTLQRVVKEIGLSFVTSADSNADLHLTALASSKVEVELLTSIFQTAQQSLRAGNFAKGTRGLLKLGSILGMKGIDEATGTDRAQLGSSLDVLEANNRDKSDEAVSILARWLRGSRPAERRAAAGTLARIYTPEAILALGPLLSDTDFEVRWRVIGGLSLFANNALSVGGPPAPGAWPFRSESTIRYSVFDRDFLLANGELEYLQFWMKWWAEKRGAIEAMVK